MTTWNRAFVWGWVAILFILGLYEMYAVFFGHSDPPLTDVVARYVPWPVTMFCMTWLWLHFALQYTYPNWLVKFFKG